MHVYPANVISVSAWGNSTATASENTSLGASLTSIASQDETASDSLPSMSSESESAGPSQTGAGPAPSMCATGGNIGNHTVNVSLRWIACSCS